MKTNREYITNLRDLRRLYLETPTGLTDTEAALLLRLDRRQVYRYRQMLSSIVPVNRGRYTTVPSPDEIEFARAILWRARWERKAADAYLAADDADARDAAD